MTSENRGNLKLGSNVIELLLPHRRPFIMVDFIDSYQYSPKPSLRAGRHISANEEVFKGHFPNLHIWPGVYTQEGLGQACNLLLVLVKLQRAWEEKGHDPIEVIELLRNLELGFRLHPGFKPAFSKGMLSAFDILKGQVGMSSSVEMKFLQPVFAGQCLDYQVNLTHEFDRQARFEVEAQVGGIPVARGKLTAVLGIRVPLVQDQE